jgi:glycine cleavage system H lipoate-binding protein/ABC-type phosphate transport system substrate-binding protein
MSSPDLFNLTAKWASEYYTINPKIKINVIRTDPGRENLNANLKLGFVSHEYFLTINNEALWKTVVGRDVIVPIINSKNPFLDEIKQQGISSERLGQIFTNPEKRRWGTLLGNAKNVPVKYYLINNESIKSDVANFLNADQNMIDGIIVGNGKEMVSAIQKDPYAIGFCKMTDIIDSKNQQIVENIKLMPIDKNNNGRIDYNEKIYDDLNVFTRGVWIGKYPKVLYSNIYSISSAQPTSEIEVAFLKWILTDGQQFINSNGYSELAFSERQTKVDKLVTGKIDQASSNNDYANLKMALLILAVLFVIGFLLDTGIRYSKRKKTRIPVAASISPLVFNENSVTLLNGLYFDKSHTWAFMEKDGDVKIGIDDFLQHITGSITQLKMKNPGERIEKGEPVLSIIQKGKQLNINAPVSGIIKEQNQKLITNPSIINSYPYSDGWVYLIEPSNWLREIQFLIMAEKYKKWLKNEFSRLKDFLSVFVKPGTVEYAHVILQDGGELKDNLLSELGPEVWEDFQTNFIDTSK